MSGELHDMLTPMAERLNKTEAYVWAHIPIVHVQILYADKLREAINVRARLKKNAKS